METYFKNITIQVIAANGAAYDYHVNNDYVKYTEEEIADMFNLTPLREMMANRLEGNNFTSCFNTYNGGSPFTFDGVLSEDYQTAIVNIHLGGDVRGNYSDMYFCDEADALLSQSSFLTIELSDGSEFNFDCDNGEAYFDFDTFDPYYVDFSKPITKEQLNELNDKNQE